MTEMPNTMTWQTPGDEQNKPPAADKGAEHSNNNEQGPPNLDEVFGNITRKWRRQKNQRRSFRIAGDGDDNNNGNGGSGSPLSIMKYAKWVIALLVAIWLASGFYVIDPAEQGVVLRFGAYHKTTTAGPHWHLPYPFEAVEIVNVTEIRNVEIGYRSGSGRLPGVERGETANFVSSESLMLTGDENIIDIQFAVQYRVADAADYLFHVRDPDEALKQVTESAVREIIGKSTMDFVLTEGRDDVAENAHTLIQGILDRYRTGLQVSSVNMQNAQAPEQVQAAFSDAVKAREDRERLINEAQAYANDVIPKARGASARVIEDARAYREQVIANAEGESSRFVQILAQYRQATDVTKTRLYLETLQEVLGTTNKYIVDNTDSRQVLVMPLGNNGMPILPLPPAVNSQNTQSTVENDGASSAVVNTGNGIVDSTTNRLSRALDRLIQRGN